MESEFLQEYIKKNRKIQKNLIKYLNEDEDSEFYFDKLNQILKTFKIQEDKYELKTVLHLISNISKNTHRSLDFFQKIERVLTIFLEDIKNYFTNYEIFNTFRGSKRILLFLIKQNIMIPDKTISNIITKSKYMFKYYPHYFYPEFKSFFDPFLLIRVESERKRLMNDNEDPEYFFQMRLLGENEKFICKLIRNDSIEDFISYINKNNISVSTEISKSIFETNSLLLKKNISLIEYAAFYGSVQIFKYLFMNGVHLDSNLWLYAIHGNDPNLIHQLEENHVIPENLDYKICLFQSIKCYDINLTKYIQDCYLQNMDNTNFEIIKANIKYYNFIYFPVDFPMNLHIFYEMCKYDYCYLVNLYLYSNIIDINELIILNICFQSRFKLDYILMKFLNIIFVLMKFKINQFNSISKFIIYLFSFIFS